MARLQPFPKDPLEVFQAIEGDTDSLVSLLRSEEPLDPETREALALWLEGNLPPKRGRGRPKKMRARGQWPDGREVELAAAVERYRWFRRGLKARGIYSVSAERLIEKIASHMKQTVSANQLRAALKGDFQHSQIAEVISDRFILWRRKAEKNRPK